MRMWNVRSEDLRLDKMQWNSLDVQKVISETAIGEVAQRLHQRKADVIMKNEMSNVQWRCKKVGDTLIDSPLYRRFTFSSMIDQVISLRRNDSSLLRCH